MKIPRTLGTKGKVIAVATAGVLLVGAGTGVGMAVGSTPSANGGAGMGQMASATPSGHTGKKTAKVSAARVAWAHKYGQNRDQTPNLPDVASATPDQRAAALTLLTTTEADTAKYADVSVAKAAGYDLQAALAKAEAKAPRLKALLARIDVGTMPKQMPMLHVANPALRHDGKVLDPTAPETLMYQYTGGGNWKLVGVMYVADEAFPAAPPAPGGPITRWHYHTKNGPGASLMMHVFFVPGNDLAQAYALRATVM